MTTQTLKARIRVNQQAKCGVAFCTRHRFGAAKHCHPHVIAWRRYGHPLGRRLFPHEYATYRAEVAKLLTSHPDHAGGKTVLTWIEQWMERAWRGERVPAAKQLARLFAHGIAAERVLEEIAAIWRYSHKGPLSLPDDERRDFALANALFRLAPRDVRRSYTASSGKRERSYVPIPRGDRVEAAKAIRENLGLFLHHVSVSLDEQAADEAATEAALRRLLTAPFSTRLRITPLTH